MQASLCFLFAIAVVPCYAATFYTTATGNDGFAGTLQHPFRTVKRGATALQPGDVLLVGPGIYSEALLDSIPQGLDWQYPVTIRALDPSQRPILRPAAGKEALRVIQIETYADRPAHHIIVDGFVIDGSNVIWEGIKISQRATEIRILNCEVAHAPGSGIVIDHTTGGRVFMFGLNVHDNGRTELDHGIYIAASNNTIEHSQVHDNAGWGIHVYTGTGRIENDVVQYNTCYRNAKAGGGGAGVGLYSGSGHIAKNNSVWGNRQGIHVDFGATEVTIQDNEVVGNSDYGVIIGKGARNIRVTGNVVSGQPVNIQDNSRLAVLQGNRTR